MTTTKLNLEKMIIMTDTSIISSTSNTLKKKDLVEFLKQRRLKSSFPRKQDLLKYIQDIRWSIDFPWRDEQLCVMEKFESFENKSIIGIQGLFGCGKTTLLLGMLNTGFWKNMFHMNEICFCAFNVCIKDEIRKKIKSWGCKDKPIVRTFDSLIYEFCEYYEYPHLKLPNYKGKRLFIYEKCRQKHLAKKFDKYNNVKYLFVDECQDLERQSFHVFKTFFPNAKIVFVGDIFQSVQKEPRESLLWYISQDIRDDIHYFYMKDTPRVPKLILNEIQTALTTSYPEYTSQIMEWESTSQEQTNPKIEWMAFDSYKTLYEHLFRFIESHPPEKSMILTFSSCITVRGALGDLARVRRIIQQKGYAVNTNYKSMTKDCLFLSTANSSKGLERDHVFVMSTFPLEKAFINFSNDLTTNLITVALSRAKKSVVMCVPSDKGRFSTAFYSYKTCPQPSTHILSTKSKHQSIMDKVTDEMSKEDYFFLEHNVTELLRQGIVQYETRLLFKSFVKKRIQKEVIENRDNGSTPPPPLPKSCLQSEEERSFVGVCLEVLMTSVWTNAYPSIPSIGDVEQNPYYRHCISKIKDLRKIYATYCRQYRSSLSNTYDYFKTIFLYTELHIAMHHKMFFYFRENQKHDLFRYWIQYRPSVYRIRPHVSEGKKMQTQSNVKMPLITGIADAILNDKHKHVYEIKASIKNDWKEDAFVQAFCYGIMMGQAWFHIHLVNLFKNAQHEYIIYIPDVKSVRQSLLYDVLIWNSSSYLAKNLTPYASTHKIESFLFVHAEYNVLTDKIVEIVVIRMLSPTRIHIDMQSSSNDCLDAFHTYLEKFEHDAFEFIHCCSETVSDKLKNAFPYIPIREKWPDLHVCTFEKELPSCSQYNIVLQTIDFISQILVK